MLIVNKLKSYNSGFLPAVECHSCGNRFITSSTDNKKLCNICKSKTKNITAFDLLECDCYQCKQIRKDLKK